MMSLKSYCGKNVRIVTVDNQILVGVVDDYFFPEDNENGVESIVLETSSGECCELTEDVIVELTII